MLSTDQTIQIAQDAGRLTLEIVNQRPVELLDLTTSFLSVGDEYRRFATSHGLVGAEDARFYIQQIRTGSIIADLVPMVPLVLAATLPLLDGINNVIQFAQYLKVSYNVLLGLPERQPSQLDKRSLENLSHILEPIVSDQGSQMHIRANHISFNAPIQMTYNHIEANAIQNSVQRRIQEMQEPVTGVHRNVLLYWYQARNTPASSPIDRGIIESISPNPVKVVFSNETIKAKMLFEDENPFRMAYIIDVAVETINGRPTIYNVLAVHDKVERVSPDNQGDLFPPS